jgi:hypothetical protein
MTKEEFDILEKMCAGLITQEEVDAVINWKKSKAEIEELLDNCLAQGNPENNFEVYFWNTPSDLSQKEDEELNRKYLLIDGHFEHENIASGFQTYYNYSPENVNILIQAIKNVPKHLEAEDFKYSYIRKCIYAIGAQPEPENFNGLNLLTESEDIQIKELAIHQIEKRKNRGYWEKEK